MAPCRVVRDLSQRLPQLLPQALLGTFSQQQPAQLQANTASSAHHGRVAAIKASRSVVCVLQVAQDPLRSLFSLRQLCPDQGSVHPSGLAPPTAQTPVPGA